jgi:hypothetical protein
MGWLCPSLSLVAPDIAEAKETTVNRGGKGEISRLDFVVSAYGVA